jgi:hypothetical protein
MCSPGNRASPAISGREYASRVYVAMVCSYGTRIVTGIHMSKERAFRISNLEGYKWLMRNHLRNKGIKVPSIA